MRHNANLDSATKTYYQCGMLRTTQGLEKLRELLADPLGDNAVALDDEIWTLSGGMIDLGDVEVFIVGDVVTDFGYAVRAHRLATRDFAVLPEWKKITPHWLDDVTIGMKYADLAAAVQTIACAALDVIEGDSRE